MKRNNKTIKQRHTFLGVVVDVVVDDVEGEEAIGAFVGELLVLTKSSSARFRLFFASVSRFPRFSR